MIRSFLPCAPWLMAAGLLAAGGSVAETAGGATSAEITFQSGVHYREVSPAQPVSTDADRVEVAEFFWYGCPHCYSFESTLDSWLPEKPANVEFVRVPIMFHAPARVHARVFYTAEELGVLERIHAPFFDEIHVNGQRLMDMNSLTEFFARYGDVDAESFRQAFSSPAVKARLQQADRLMRGYQIGGVPTMTVDGRYVTDSNMAQGDDNLLRLIEQLAAREN